MTTGVEFPLTLVTSPQPERIMADTKSVEVRKKIRARELGRACGSVERNRDCEDADTTRQSREFIRFRSTGRAHR